MIRVANHSIRQRVLSFFEMNEGLIKGVQPKSYLDYLHYFFLPIAFIIAYFTSDYYFFYNRTSFAFGIWFLFGIVWSIILKILYRKKDKVYESMKTGIFLDLSVYDQQFILYRVLSGAVFCAVIGLIVYTVLFKSYNFTVDDLFIYIFCFWILLISGNYLISKDNNTIQIIKIEQDQLRIEYKKGEKYILLKKLKQIKIAETHLSFFPREGKIEMLKDLEFDNEEQLKLKNFLQQHLFEIPVSIYETNLRVFKENEK